MSANHVTGRRRGAGVLFVMAVAFAGGVAAGPDIERWETDQGAEVLFVESRQLPMLDVQVVFDAGAARDGDRPGIASLTNGLLFEGTDHLNAGEIARGFESLGAQYQADSMRDMASVSLRTLSDPATRDAALELFATVLTEASFPEQAVSRDRNNTLLALRLEQQQPGAIAERAFYSALYGEHPYATMPAGTAQSIESIQRGEILAFKSRYYVAANAVIAIVGDLSRGQAEALAATLSARLPAGEPPSQLPAVPSLVDGVRRAIPHPSQQTHILLGQPGMSRDDPDYFPLYVGNHILGGSGLVSRISQEIREQRGLAYSAYSYFLPMRRTGPWLAGLQTRNDQADEAVALLREVVTRFVAQGPTREELKAAKANITGGFPLRLDSNRNILEHLAMIGFYDLPEDYLDTFTQKVDEVTAAQIRDAFQRRLHPERLALITVGG
ncbi:MAG: pitrilysin family protein [Pseudomonadota bacterium]|nr:pitrilysin family protein [Pseudomonadota bacterium]